MQLDVSGTTPRPSSRRGSVVTDILIIQPFSAFKERVFSVLRSCTDGRRERVYSDHIGAAALKYIGGARTKQMLRFVAGSSTRRVVGW